MARVIMTCGRICSGKSTYARKLKDKLGSVILSIDDLMLDIPGSETGDKHDEYVRRIQNYLYKKSVEIVSAGTNVILDWGFWKKSEREYAREFYRAHGISCEFHYISVDDAEWKRSIEKRNAEVRNGRSDAYFIDEGLAAKFEELFEVPDRSEMDMWI